MMLTKEDFINQSYEAYKNSELYFLLKLSKEEFTNAINSTFIPYLFNLKRGKNNVKFK